MVVIDQDRITFIVMGPGSCAEIIDGEYARKECRIVAYGMSGVEDFEFTLGSYRNVDQARIVLYDLAAKIRDGAEEYVMPEEQLL